MAAGQLPYALMSAPVAADASQPNAVRHVPSSNSTLPSCIGAGKPARNRPSAAGGTAPCRRSRCAFPPRPGHRPPRRTPRASRGRAPVAHWALRRRDWAAPRAGRRLATHGRPSLRPPSLPWRGSRVRVEERKSLRSHRIRRQESLRRWRSRRQWALCRRYPAVRPGCAQTLRCGTDRDIGFALGHRDRRS